MSMNPQAVLVTGVYGAGKSTVVADMGAFLGGRGESYGLIDVDWLGWFDAGGTREAQRAITLANLDTLCRRYLEAGVRRLALAWSVRDLEQLEGVRRAVGIPLRVVRLEVSSRTVTERLSIDPTEERRDDDLRVALEWLASGTSVGLEDLLLSGAQPVRRTTEEICSWLGWA